MLLLLDMLNAIEEVLKGGAYLSSLRPVGASSLFTGVKPSINPLLLVALLRSPSFIVV